MLEKRNPLSAVRARREVCEAAEVFLCASQLSKTQVDIDLEITRKIVIPKKKR